MKKLTRRQLINSLLFPVGIIVWELICYVYWSIKLGGIQPVFLFQWSYIIAAAVCGLLPVILTLTTGAETGQYILPRVLISVSTLGVIGIASEFVLVYDSMLILLLITSLVVSALYFYKFRPAKFSEWIIIFLSNPVLVALIYYPLLFQTYNEIF